ncbi:hypothetical protein [Negadavirga shengliensis]|uniref:Uncharacterized protein n=1 Tax=Negadavirga shengliensis TaxID=1389218 RepID=A0ABV9T1E5_9BACT
MVRLVSVAFLMLSLTHWIPSMGQVQERYNIVSTDQAYVIKPEKSNVAHLNLERIGLNCSTPALSNELSFQKIKKHFDEEKTSIFREIKIQARVYFDIQGYIQEVYFISENDPEKFQLDYNQIANVIKRKIQVMENEDCVPKEEGKYIAWYIPLYEL